MSRPNLSTKEHENLTQLHLKKSLKTNMKTINFSKVMALLFLFVGNSLLTCEIEYGDQIGSFGLLFAFSMTDYALAFCFYHYVVVSETQ